MTTFEATVYMLEMHRSDFFWSIQISIFFLRPSDTHLDKHNLILNTLKHKKTCPAGSLIQVIELKVKQLSLSLHLFEGTYLLSLH